jgi:predicted  nucleic acid-binding Zn-ribbon protein
MTEELRQARLERDEAKSASISMEKDGGQGLDRLRGVEAERDALRQEVEGVKAGLDRMKQHVTSMQTRHDKMRDEIARLKAALGHAPDAMS